jgi:hypothetical protein
MLGAQNSHPNIGNTSPVIYVLYPLYFAAIGAKIEVNGYSITLDIQKQNWGQNSIYSNIREYCDLTPILPIFAGKNSCR